MAMASLLPVLLLALWAAAPPSVLSVLTDPSFCLWMAKEEVGGGGDCVPKCHQLCKDHLPGEYFCTGQLVHTDTDDFRYDDGDTKKYSYCFCQRSVPARSPGSWCGPGGQVCPTPGPDDYVDGVDNLVEGAQGDMAGLIANRTASGVIDDDVDGACDDGLFSRLRYMFKPAPTI